ncbi:MAG: hypothetical protein ACYS0H_18920 [Planctomycetota bacterium]|jgi:hypothetical protein
MTREEEAIEQEHRDFLREIANKVYGLVRDPVTMARFRSQLRLFCEKNEEHQKEVERLRRASLTDSKLQSAIKKLEKKIWGKTWEEMTEEERNGVHPLESDSRANKLEGFEHYVSHAHLEDYDGGRSYCQFWGPAAKTASLCEFLESPETREWGSFPNYWSFEFSREPDDDEKLICCYALLANIHDMQILEKPIFTAKIYNGAWRLRNKWKGMLWESCTGEDWNAIPSLRIDGLRKIRAWVQRALSDVKADLARIGPAETEQETKCVKKREQSKRGRPKKYTTEQRAKMRDMYRRIYLETNDSKEAYNKVADYYGIVSGDAVKAAIRNLNS